MNPLSNTRTIIVGAGGGGVASALLSGLRGEEVLLLEAHSALGGCASWFGRGPFIFDAGATTLSGVGVKEPLGELFELLGAAPEMYPSDPGIVFHLSSGKTISYHRDFEKWMVELHHHFPGMNHRPFWEKVRSINKKSWALLGHIPIFPFRSLSDVVKVLKHPSYACLLPHLLLSTSHALKFYGLDSPEMRELIDGILLISAQAPSENIPFLVGAMALSYPAETYAPIGGMKGLMEFFETELKKRNVQIKKRTEVSRLESRKVILKNGEEIKADRIIANLPIWNLAHLTAGALHEDFGREAALHPGAWGALTIYCGVQKSISSCYHQVHLNHPLVKNYFVSFSVPGDRRRAPEGFQSVTISTHVFAEDLIPRQDMVAVIMDDFCRRFGIEQVKHLTSGVPKTFERYTGRWQGFVGGLPFLYGKNPFSLLSPLTKETDFFRVGDTVFPGQGLCAVVAGALMLHRRFNSEGN